LATLAIAASGQQIPFISITGQNAPKGASFLLEDTVRGGLWLGGAVEGTEGLTYFDGSRFVSPLRDPFPKVFVSGMAEDVEGGIWLATSGGLYRAFRGHLDRMTEGDASSGLVQAAPNVFLSTVTKPGAGDAELLRVAKAKRQWKSETIIPSTPQARLQADYEGNILYECPDGYCEFRGADAVHWQAGASLPITRHRSSHPPRFTEDSVFRDRFGCVWQRSVDDVMYQCPGDERARSSPESIAGPGAGSISELDDGSIIIPSFAKLAIGRPGHFRIITAVNGNPGTINTVATREGSIWLSNANGLFVFPSQMRIEFWTEREGLDGNTWGILRTPSKTFAIAGGSLRVLDPSRSHWNLLAAGHDLYRLSAGPNGTFLAGRWARGVLQLTDKGILIGKVHRSVEGMSEGGVQTDAHGDSWTCADDGRLLRKTLAWHPIAADEGALEQNCHYLAVDARGDVWYGDDNAHGAGFALLERPAGILPQLRHFVSGGEVGNATVRFFGVDRRGWIWRGSPVGIYVADPEQARQGQWLYLNRLDGVAGTDANRRSFFSDPDGSVWFGLDNSVNHFYPPDDFPRPKNAPAVFVSGYSWNGGEMQMADMVAQINNGATLTAHIGSLQYDRRNALRLRYRLLPEQTQWRETKSLDLPLGVLPSGSHILEVQGRIFTGPWSKTVSHSFNVLPPVWLSGRFLLTYILGGAVLFTSVLLLRRKRQWEERALLPDLGEWRLSALNPDGHELAGAVLDNRFEVGDLLARGGFASVMAGFDRNKQRRCAIKIFRGELKDKTSVLRGFEQEVAALRQIHHPNIVSIYADGLTPSGAPYLAMEFVEGKNLRDILKDGPLPSVRAGRLLEQLANALDAIHERGICHRDVKPENVIVRSNGAVQEEAVLIDFSIAIIKDANETLYGLSRAAGTFDYMAPEQAMGHAQPASDIFSLAKVTIELLTGARVSVLLPNAALDLPLQAAEMLKKRNLNLTSDSVFMLASALEFDPSRRPNVASQFAKPIVRDLIISNQNTL
jgi:hypothetical protein